MFESGDIADFDGELWAAIKAEQQRQEDHVELIASENYASPLVLEAQGSVLTNKYAEGYAGRRYYGGCEHVDEAERLAVERAKTLFGADYANVQPHSGSSANMAAYLALLGLDRSPQRYELRRHLLEMDDRLLDDIGFSRVEARQEAAKPFWKD